MPRFHLESKKKKKKQVTNDVYCKKEMCVEISDVSGRGRGSCVGSGKNLVVWNEVEWECVVLRLCVPLCVPFGQEDVA